MQVLDMEWEIPVSAQPLNLPPERPITSNGIHRRLSRRLQGHRRILSMPKSSSASPPATFRTAREEDARQSFIETGAVDTTHATGIKRDWTITQKAWWDAILLMHANPSVVRVALEMRIMGGSDIILSPECGNALGTCSIEILTTLDTPHNNWLRFCQKVTDKWLSYQDRSTGKRLLARPHWCKQWSFLNLPDDQGGNLKAVDWMREVGYKDEIPKFMNTLKRIGEGAGFTLDDLRARFGNRFMDSIFWDGSQSATVIARPQEHRNRFLMWLKKLFS
jgi:hypothetical protein